MFANQQEWNYRYLSRPLDPSIKKALCQQSKDLKMFSQI
jgi:hypothetical protein